jgi:ABC-2 type transport system ATP-binding protein
MIDVSQLTKRYGPTLAVDHVSFSIRPGEVIGLLGPNGAGKTTMLKILTGYLPPTEGSAQVAGLDVVEKPLEVRKRLGYLPETNPLYDELAVLESLQWAARLRGVSSETSALRPVIKACGLESVAHKDISELSKGYRQRVGLAQAILHDPEILILDEPTSGLDPNQQLEVRQLIQTLRQRKTVILSTHILSEAQSSCDRVLIVHRGRIVADGSPRDLMQGSGATRLDVELKAPAFAQEQLLQIAGVRSVTTETASAVSTLFHIEASAETDIREAVFELASRNRWPILHMTRAGASLEEVFRQLTTGAAS